MNEALIIFYLYVFFFVRSNGEKTHDRMKSIWQELKKKNAYIPDRHIPSGEK